MHAVAAQGIQVGRQDGDERFALAGAHLGDVAVVQHHAANELHVERPHAERTKRRLARHGKRLRKQAIEALPILVALAKFFRPGAQRVVVESLDALLECIDTIYDFPVLPQQALVAAAKQPGKKVRHSQLLENRTQSPLF